ncbi:nucleotidyltransferase [Herminiimonas sp. KBW02]|uniref:Nucleotidyltransferase n=1 Tax=Herminiimonas glaciei TaxID=523788 RepID=A0ABW2I8V1_9BURK|nr:nucleotidyltransferase [Herminiimonas sp. KBW02]RQO36445.1 nucleotidyltransferase [Herminiimonas sp. KBW02]
MATTTIAAFDDFLRDQVNLDSAITDTARRSRDWLMDRIHGFPVVDQFFPKLYNERDIFFGSFERRTKKRPLDDIDIMIGLHADGATYEEYGGKIFISTTNETSALFKLRFENSNYINSKRVINKFVNALSNIPQYGNAEIGRKGEAAVLSLNSYPWVYDLVPCFYTSPDVNGIEFYLIPDGDGNWQKTDPRIDRARVTRLERSRGKNLLDVIRLVKFWNRRPTMPSLPSYLLENMVLDYYEQSICNIYPDLEFRDVINYIRSAVYHSVFDPKGIQGDLNNVAWTERVEIATRCALDYAKALEAREFESKEDYRGSINKWREIFGPTFPTFG